MADQCTACSGFLKGASERHSTGAGRRSTVLPVNREFACRLAKFPVIKDVKFEQFLLQESIGCMSGATAIGGFNKKILLNYQIRRIA